MTPTDQDAAYGYSIRISMDGLTLDLQLRAETEFTKRQTVNALRDTADQIEKEALENEEIEQ